MSNFSKNIIVPRTLIRKKSGIVILPLEEYEKILEDLEMIRSKSLARHIEKARKEARAGKLISLQEVERKLKL